MFTQKNIKKSSPTIVLIAGGSCSGKSEFSKWFENSLVISLDYFYKDKEFVPKDEEWGYNFDHPEAVAIDECADALRRLLKNKKVMVPDYDMLSSTRVGKKEIRLNSKIKFIIVEGMFVFYPPLRELGDMKIFLDTPAEIRVARRMIRDIKRKGRTKVEIMANFVHAERNYSKFVEPMKKYADLIVPFSFNPVKFKK